MTCVVRAVHISTKEVVFRESFRRVIHGTRKSDSVFGVIMIMIEEFSSSCVCDNLLFYWQSLDVSTVMLMAVKMSPMSVLSSSLTLQKT